jgi:2'-5' RNA ligase
LALYFKENRSLFDELRFTAPVMHRLFVALLLPTPVRQACLDAMEPPLPGWAWQDEEQLHVTLRFIGVVDRRTAEDIASALGGVHAPRQSIALAGVGWFDRGGGGALFARVAPRDPLAALHAKIDRALVAAGQPPEGRSYLPHVTLARGRDGAARPEDWIRRNAGLSTDSWAVDRFHLIESTLARSGALYEIAESYPLG